MTEVLSPLTTNDFGFAESDEMTLKFVEDTDYEFVGGGNAVNGF